ncbi:MAG: gamma-glutamyltransferase [Actinomycetia bacterium]|nr:gamma-glutamyltransferase [Actinomycetes bacterium]
MTQVSVASPLRLATDAGLDAVRAGGNAIDAALATAAVLTVAYPASCAIGGDLLALVREPDGRTTFIDASGRALLATDPDAVRSKHSEMPIHGPLPVTVPGMVGGWSALADHGAALPWRDLLAAAEEAAASGFPVSAGLAESIAGTIPTLGAFPDLAAVLCPGGMPLVAGQTMRQPALARTLGVLADAGPSALYDGQLSAALCAGLSERGVPMTRNDLRDFRVEEAAPLHVDVDGWQVLAGRPSSQAYLVLRLLGLLNTFDATDPDTAIHRRLPAHQLARAFLRVSEERDAILADPRFMTQSVEDLLTPAALQKLADDVIADDGTRTRHGTPSAHPDGDTVAVVAADDEGRSVSLIQSLFHGFGSLILEPSTGMLMHDRGACFVLDPRSPNVLAPGKRPLHTLSPVLAQSLETPDSDRLVVGTMGGHVQPQILTQVFSRLMAGDSAQQAVGAPRFTVGAWEADDAADMLNVESDIDPSMLHELDAYSGPRTMLASHDSRVGHAHAISVTGSGAETRLDAGSDPRADG